MQGGPIGCDALQLRSPIPSRRGGTPPPKLAHVKIRGTGRFPVLRSRLLTTPRPHSLHPCQPPAVGQQSPRTPTRRHATGAHMGRPQGIGPKPQRSAQPAGSGALSGWVPSGYDRKTPGTPGTNARIGAKSLPCLVFSVPCRTGDKTPNTGDTGDNSFQRSAQQHGQQAGPLCLVPGALSGGHLQREANPRHHRPSAARSAQGSGSSPVNSGLKAGAHTSSSKMVGAIR